MKTLKKILRWIGYVLLMLMFVFVVMVIIPEREIVESIQPRDSTQYWEMNEGFKIAYTHLKGVDSLKESPVIFLHGGPGGYVHSSIIETLRALAEVGHDVYLYDQRGSGLSDRLPRFSDINFEKHLSDLHEIVKEKVKSEKVILMGQSFGCNIISHYSVRHPERIDKIIFSSPGEILPISNERDLDTVFVVPDSLNFIEPYSFVHDVDKTARKPKAILAITGAMLLDKKLVSDKQMDRILNTLASKFTRGMVCDQSNVLPEEGGGGLYAFIATNNQDMPEIRGEISNVRAPVLVLHGQCDYIPYAYVYEYVDLYPNAEYRFIENAGHEIWWEKEEVYIQEIINFLME